METLGIALMWAGAFALIGLGIYIFREKHVILYCPQCGYVGFPKKKMPGSFGIEIVLWLCLILPGLIYSLWRWSSIQKICGCCGASGLIPTNSPRAIAAHGHPRPDSR